MFTMCPLVVPLAMAKVTHDINKLHMKARCPIQHCASSLWCDQKNDISVSAPKNPWVLQSLFTKLLKLQVVCFLPLFTV